jgi:hypothetical protein
MTATPILLTYKAYKLVSRAAPDGMSAQVEVFDPRYKRDPAIYRTTSLDLAMKWVDAYREGQQWAIKTKVG